MSTPDFQVQVESFLRRMGEGDITIAYTGHTPNNTLQRISFKAIYDYFYVAGLSLYRVLRRLVPLELKKHSPSFFFQETVSLASNVGTITTKYEMLNDEASVTTLPPNGEIPCLRFPVDLDRSILFSTGGRFSPVATAPRFEVVSSVITVYPISPNRGSIKLSGFKALPRIQLADDGSYSDIWNADFGDLLIDGALSLAKGDNNEASLGQFYMQAVMAKYNIYKQPIVKNVPTIPEEIK